MSTLSRITAAVERAEKTQLGQQLFRVVRLVLVGVLAAELTHSPLDTTAIVAIVETAFRQVFPPTS